MIKELIGFAALLALWVPLIFLAFYWGDNESYISECRFPGLWIPTLFFGWIPIAFLVWWVLGKI